MPPRGISHSRRNNHDSVEVRMSDVGGRVSFVPAANDLRPTYGHCEGRGGPTASATAFHSDNAQPGARAAGDAADFADHAFADPPGRATHLAEHAAAEPHSPGQPAGGAAHLAEYAAAQSNSPGQPAGDAAQSAGNSPTAGPIVRGVIAQVGRKEKGRGTRVSLALLVFRMAQTAQRRLKDNEKSSNCNCRWPLPESAKNCSSRSRTKPDASR